MLINRTDSRHSDRVGGNIKRPSFRGLFAAGGMALVVGLLGCGGDDAANNSAGNSKFEVADDSSDSPAQAPSTPETDPPQVAQQLGEGQPSDGQPSGSQPDGLPGNASPPAGLQPPADPGPTLEGYKAPDGSVEELFAFMQNIDSRQPQGATQAEQMADLVQMQQAIAEAADKVMASEQATDEQKVEAANRKLTAYATLEQFEVEGIGEKIKTFSQELVKHENAQLQELGRLMLLNQATADFIAGDQETPDALLTHLKQVLNDLDANETLFGVSSSVAGQLERAGFSEAAEEAFEAIRTKFQDHESPMIQEAIASLDLRNQMRELGFNEKLRAILEDQPDAVDPFMQVMQKVAQQENPGAPLFQLSSQASQLLEMTGHYHEALQVMQWADEALAKVDDEELRAQTAEAIAAAKKRLGLVGKPLPLEGAMGLDGEAFDWKSYRGNWVLVDFWASWCGPCIAEFPEMKKEYAEYNPQGFEIVGINLDDTVKAAKEFLQETPLPWRTVVSGNQENLGFANPVAQFAGVEAIPFIVLVDPEGNVSELHVRGPKLGEQLREIYGGEEAPAGEAAPPAEAAVPAADDSSRLRRRAPGSSFVSLLDEESADQPAENATESNESVEEIARQRKEVAQEEDRKFGEIQGIAIDNSINPYAPDAGLSKLELAQLLLEMRDKPQSIQRRPGFSEAVLTACDLLIERTGGEGRFYEIAVLEKLGTLHRLASFGDEQADTQLQEFVATLNDSPREKIAAEVAFLQIERRVIEVAESDSAEVADLLTELEQFYAAQTLEEKHLRMASSTVKAINKIDDADLREQHFQEFGKLFASSDNKELSRYGKRLSKSEGETSDLVGKPLELEGLTAGGLPLDWASYRGKPVIVDFWATWCGPCRREMPKLMQAYDEHKQAGLEVIGISLDQDTEALAAYLEENKIIWQTLVGEEAQALATKYGVRGIPTMMLIDAQGNVAAVAHNLDALLPKMKQMLAGPEEVAEKEAA